MTDTIARPYSRDDVLRLRGSVRVEHTLARLGAERLRTLLAEREWVPALGAMTGGQAVQMVRVGLEAIYLSGWQVAADANLVGGTYPDQSLYPANSGPALARRINNALLRADQIAHAEGDGETHWLAPIVADAEAGFGGPLNAFEIMKAYIEAGAAAVHFEDQLSSEKKCGHLGGKVLVPTSQFVRTLVAARLAADVLDVPALIVARTDALSAALLTSDVDEADRELCTGERTPEGFFRVRDGIEAAIARGLAYAPYADLVWCETSTPDMDEAERFAAAIHERYPGKLLAYNCSPSLQLARPPLRRRDRRLPARSGEDGLSLPVHHAGRLPRAQPLDVRARERLPRRSDDSVRRAAGARILARGVRLHGDPPPAGGGRRVLRPGDAGRLGRRLLDARPDRLDRRAAVRGRKERSMTAMSTIRERPVKPAARAPEAPRPTIVTRAESAPCTCPEHCERDHEQD